MKRITYRHNPTIFELLKKVLPITGAIPAISMNCQSFCKRVLHNEACNAHDEIRTLPEEKRKVILLYYFEGMTDVEIGKLFDTSRSTIQYRRTSSFEHLKRYLEEHADEWDEW